MLEHSHVKQESTSHHTVNATATMPQAKQEVNALTQVHCLRMQWHEMVDSREGGTDHSAFAFGAQAYHSLHRTVPLCLLQTFCKCSSKLSLVLPGQASKNMTLTNSIRRKRQNQTRIDVGISVHTCAKYNDNMV